MKTKYLLRVLLALIVSTSFWMGKTEQNAAAQTVWTEVATPAQFNAIRGNLTGNYRLMADIDLSAYTDWTPIGTTGSPFNGRLDGNGKVVHKLTINNTTLSNQGLFAAIGASGKISNLTLRNANISMDDSGGLLAGINQGEITKTSAEGTITGVENIGGLVGENKGVITNSYTRAAVTGRKKIGGLVGSNTGTISSSYAATLVSPSLLNTYVQFTGGGDSTTYASNYISIPHRSNYLTASFTLEAWFQWDQAGTDNVDFVVSKGVEQFEIHTGGGGVNGIRFIPVNRADTVWCTGYAGCPSPVPSGSAYQDVKNVLEPGWNHVAVVWDFSTQTARVFVNGEAQDIYQGTTNVGKVANIGLRNPSVNPLGTNTNPFYIGKRLDNWFPFAGKISEVRFWNKVRTAEEISADKYRQLTGTETGLVGYWKLNEASGDVAFDSTPNHNHGTIVGGTRVQEAAEDLGGLVGINSGSVTSSFFDREAAGQSDSGKGDQMATSDMKNPSTFIAWDTSAIWKVQPGAYPAFIQHSLSYTAGSNGSITGETSQTVTHGGAGSLITAVPNGGYNFVKWSDNVMTAARQDLNVTVDKTVTALFALPDTTAPAVLPVTLTATIGSDATSLGLTFNEELKNDGSAGAANNPANYLLFGIGADNVFNTVNCAGGIVNDDVPVSVGPVSYNNVTNSVSLTFNGGAPLNAGKYRLLVCGTTSIEDLAGNKLNNGLSDTVHDFTVYASTVRVTAGMLLPNSGFPAGRITKLPAQLPADVYSHSDFVLNIPTLKVQTPVVGVPLNTKTWDVTWLGEKAGYLYGSAALTLEGNSVITGHVWNADNTPGIFAGLKSLKFGDRFTIQAHGQTYTYEVQSNELISAQDVKSVFKTEDFDWITLLTCESFDAETDTYAERRVVRAILVKIK